MSPRIRNALALYAYALLGVFLLVAPWTAIWDQAVRTVPATLRGWLSSGWARGMVSGLGALDLVVAAQYGARLWTRRRGAGPGNRAG